MRKLDKALSAAIALVFVGIVGAVGYMIAADTAGERFTEFYVLGPGGNATHYPEELVTGEQAVVTLGIVNHEGQETSYAVKLTIGGEEIETFDPIMLADGGEAVREVSFAPEKAGDNQSVEFLLFKGDETTPFQSLRLFVDVRDSGVDS